MPGLLLRWLTTFLAVLLTAWLLPALITFGDLVSAAAFAAVLALLNASLRPLLLILTLPLSCLTLGLFALVVNGVVFWLAAAIVPGVVVPSFFAALLAALIVSVISTAVGLLVR